MSKNGYQQFFSKAQEAKRGDAVDGAQVKDRVQFRTRPQTSAAKPETNEQRLRRAVPMKRAKKAHAPFPWKSAAGLIATIVVVAAYLVFPDSFEHMFSRFEIRAFGEAEAADQTIKKPTPDAAEKSKAEALDKEKAAATIEKPGPDKGKDGTDAVSKELSQYENLKQRKDELDGREKELNELEEELQKQKVELDKRISQLETMRDQIGKTLKDRVDVDQEKVNKLVDLYSNMKPKQAADILANLNEELAVEVLAKMKKKNAAEIMNLLTPDKARVLSEKYTGYRRISSNQEAK